jgi:hypothetical protein
VGTPDGNPAGAAPPGVSSLGVLWVPARLDGVAVRSPVATAIDRSAIQAPPARTCLTGDPDDHLRQPFQSVADQDRCESACRTKFDAKGPRAPAVPRNDDGPERGPQAKRDLTVTARQHGLNDKLR